MITDTMRWEPAANSSCASQGLSVVIPTMGRAARSRNVVHMGRALLASPVFRHPRSELLLSHGSAESFAQRHSVDRDLADPAFKSGFAPLRGFNLSARVTHLHGPRPELFVASRFFAAAAARNEVVISMDDDVMPYRDNDPPRDPAVLTVRVRQSGRVVVHV